MCPGAVTACIDPDAITQIRADALREAVEAVKPHMNLYHAILALIQKEKDDAE